MWNMTDIAHSTERVLRLRPLVDPISGSDDMVERAFNLNVKFNEALRKIENETQQEQTA
jgi:hypothetical protein